MVGDCMILTRRIPRELAKNKIRSLSILILIVIGFGITFGGIIGNDSIIHTVEKYQVESNAEDGEFTTLSPLDDEVLSMLEDHGVNAEKAFYTDITLNSDSTLRVFRNRNSINTMIVDEGNAPIQNNDIAIEKHYAADNSIKIGQTIEVGGHEYTVNGLGSVPDYNLVIANPADLAADPETFGIAFVNEDMFTTLLEAGDTAFVFNYTYVNDGSLSDAEVKEILAEEAALGLFLQKDANNRMTEYASELTVTNNATLVFGVVFCILMAYVLVVFVQNDIEKESGIIGTFYSLGYTRPELVRHYIYLPVLLVIAATIIGILVGIAIGVPLLTADSIAYYSLPALELCYAPAYLAYGLIVPPLTTIIVCIISVTRKLSATPLALLRKKPSSTSRNKITELPVKDAIGILRFRQFTKEIRGNLIMIFGLLVSIFLLVMSTSLWGSLVHYVEISDSTVPYDYQYSVSTPPISVPKGATEAIVKKLSVYSSQADQYYDVIVLGLPADNPYYPLNNLSADSQVYVSDSLIAKLGITSASKFDLTDTLTGRQYQIEAVGEYEAPTGLYAFMDINNLRELLDFEEGYYNTLLSNDSLALDASYVLSTTTTDDIKKAAENMLENRGMMIGILMIGAVIIFIVVIYLLLKAMIDRSTYNISLLKILGYNKRELSKIYLGTSFYSVLISTAVAILFGRFMMNYLFPYFTAHLSVSIQVYIYPYMYALIIAIIFASYLIINTLLKRLLKRVSLVEILKDMD